MRKKWSILSGAVCTLGAAIASAAIANDGEPPENKTVEVVVVNKDAEGVSKVREQVAKQIEKANISDELKAEILKKVEESLAKAEEATKKAEKATGKVKAMLRAKAEAKKSEDGKSEQVTVTVLDGDDEVVANGVQGIKKLPGFANGFKTRVLRPLGVKDGEAYRIGIALAEVEEDGSNSEQKGGLKVETVVEGSPAEKAGLKSGDVVVTVNAKAITKVDDLMAAVQEAGKKDKEVTVELERDGKTLNIAVKPSKLKTADLEQESIQLSLPEGGVVLDENQMKKFQESIKRLGPGNFAGGFAFGFPGGSDEWKKEIQELKSEVAELKKLIKELVDKK